MKQILLFVLSFFLFSTAISAQSTEFAPIGAYWKYNFATAGGGGDRLTTVVGDTVVNGMTFKKLYNDEYNYPPHPSVSGYHRYSYDFLSVRNDSVFTGLNQNTYLYNFNARIGDTVKFTNALNHIRYAVADSIGRLDLGGVNRKVIYFSKFCINLANGAIKKHSNRAKLVENIGFIDDGLFWNEPDCGFIDFTLYYFTCYQAGSFRYPTNRICPPTVATNEPIYSNQISISPNPANSDLTLNFPSELQLNNVELVNYLGQKISVYSSENNQKINVSNVPNGVYFLNLWFDNQRVVKKIVIQH